MSEAAVRVTREPVAPVDPAAGEGLSPLQTFLMAVTCGVLAANLYYAQPLVDMIGPSIGLARSAEGLVVTASQVGYAVGLVFLVPLGDLIESRKLIVGTMLANVLALLAMVMTSAPTAFFVAMFTVGITSIAAQLVVPLAAGLTPIARRGAVVGRVMSGLLTGILLARPLASFLADLVGWRGLFVLSAAMITLLALLLVRILPVHRNAGRTTYGTLIASLGTIVMTQTVLRRRAFYHAMMFAAFSMFWTAAPLLLLSPAYGYSSRAVALFALAGALGVLAAPAAGALADRGWSRATTIAALSTAIAAFALAALGETSLAALVAAAILIDLGVQANMVVSQRDIYALDPAIRNRLNAVYMATFFMGGALGSALTSPVLHFFGWQALAAIGAAFPAIALAAFLLTDPASRR